MTQAKPPSATAATELEAVPRQAGDSAVLEAGMQLGAYRIRRPLGEGGMGQVYLAEQTAPVHRDVALKLIREQIASPLALAWFEVERQALAQMQHPAIAQIFDAGTTPEGHAFIAMEYVEGIPVADYCRSHALTRDQCLALFIRICQGVQHAHQKGVIHRDLKPANVLIHDVDGTPMPKIIDFGIAIGGSAGSSGPTVSNASGGHAGTAIYMSPEQAAGEGRDIDTRSDVYALGVMLFEILTGNEAAVLNSSAYQSRAVHTPGARRAKPGTGSAERHDTGAPALLDAAGELPPELRAILRQALATDRNDRYSSASALADDLERFREQRPVHALPASRAYAARKFVARHRLGIFAVSMVALALLAGVALALHGQRRAEAAAEQARIEAGKAAQVSTFVQEMIAGIDPDKAKGLDRSLMRLMLDSAAARAGTELAGQPEVRAAIERTIAQSYASLGDYTLAQDHYEASIDADRDAGTDAAQIARTMARSAQNLLNAGQSGKALAFARDAFALVESRPVHDRDRLYVESILAGIEGSTGKPEEARTRFHRVLDLQRSLFGNDSEDVLATISDLSAIDIDTAHYDEARALLEELLAERLARYGSEHSKTFNATNGLAIIALEEKRFADAEALLAPELPIVERVFGKDHPLTLRLISNLGGAIRQQDRNEDARPYYERAAALARKLYGPENIATVVAESNLSLLLRDSGDLEGAERHGRSAARNGDIALANNALRGIIHRELATVLLREKKFAEAKAELDLAWGVLSTSEGFGPQHPRSQDVVDTYVELYRAWKNPKREAEWLARKVDMPQQDQG
ncbi:MAG TPA: serine/threonine-protein kinase [Dokdonella sp.]|jgi:eukaryotic-like serine/threonine-protein kinase|nr:serine/threonine-protein kinase [Dokdonella sp.]